MENGGRIPEAGGMKARRVVIVHRPAAVGDQVVKPAFRLHLALAEHVVAEVPAALPLAGKELQPLQRPVIRAVRTAVLDVVPHPQRNTQ